MAGNADVHTTRHEGRDPATRRKAHRGQGLVELALIMPIMIVMLLGTIDFARAFSAYIQVTNAAREGAYFGARSSSNANDAVAVEAAAKADSPTIYGTAPGVSSVVQPDGDYEQIRVTVTYTFNTLIDYPGIPQTIPLSRTVTMRVIGS